MPKAERQSLDTLIREALQKSPVADPTDAANDVLANIDPSDYWQYLYDAVLLRIPAVVSGLRTRNTPVVRKGVSTKQMLIRDDYWPKFLQQRIFLSTGYKFLAEATADDLRQVAGMRVARAQELQFRADQFAALAAMMDDAKVTYLEQLDSALAQEILLGAA